MNRFPITVGVAVHRRQNFSHVAQAFRGVGDHANAYVGGAALLLAVPLMMSAAACGDSGTTAVDSDWDVTGTAHDLASDSADALASTELDAAEEDASAGGCTTSQDCETNLVCRDGTCAPECTTSDDCVDPAQWCDVATGRCVDGPQPCPVAVITVAEGEKVPPRTLLHLSAVSSYSAAGDIVRWEWDFVQISNSTSHFLPSDTQRDVTFETNLVGNYEFTLHVWDVNGVRSCVPASLRVRVPGSHLLRVDLAWTTVGTPGDGPDVGDDLDLHFVLPGGDADFFDVAYDIWADNTSNPVGSDASRLVTSDDGNADPEYLWFDGPVAGQTYRLGVHHASGVGVAHATLRIYIHGVLTSEWADVALEPGETWDAFELTWPDVIRRQDDEGRPIIRTGLGPR